MIICVVCILMRTKVKGARTLRWIGPLAFLLASSLAWGQSTSPALPTVQKVQTSLPHLYWHLLTVQNHLDQEATKRQQEGKNGDWLRVYFQQELRLTDGQFALVRSTAQRLQTELDTVDSQAKAIIDADHAAHPRQAGASRSWRPVPEELKALDQKHEDLIESEVSNLKTALGPEVAARLDAYLQNAAQRGARGPRPASPPIDPEVVRQRLLAARQKAKEAHQ